MTNWKNLHRRLLSDKLFGDKRECHQSSNGVTHARPLKKLIKAERVKEVVLMQVWLSGIKALLGTNSYLWPGHSTF
jgi:hypothetical protein